MDNAPTFLTAIEYEWARIDFENHTIAPLIDDYLSINLFLRMQDVWQADLFKKHDFPFRVIPPNKLKMANGWRIEVAKV